MCGSRKSRTKEDDDEEEEQEPEGEGNMKTAVSDETYEYTLRYANHIPAQQRSRGSSPSSCIALLLLLLLLIRVASYIRCLWKAYVVYPLH